MEPFTADGMARREDLQADNQSDSQSDTQSDNQSDSQAADSEEGGNTPIIVSFVPNTPSKQINYELVGVIVHSGQANAGHYYSYIKDRR